MEKFKKVFMSWAAFALVLALSSCAGTSAVQGANYPNGSTFTIEEIQASPASYIGRITLTGFVAASSTEDFALQNEEGTFEVHVDYRGNQALPQAGDKVAVEGQLSEKRPCCGPGFTLRSTRFELVE